MYKVVLSVALFPFLFLLGCSGLPVQSAADNENPAAGIEGHIVQADTMHIKYHNLWSTARFMVVEGGFSGSTKKYPVVLDTGASRSVFVKESHVRQNQLPCYSVAEEINDYRVRNCLIRELNLCGIKIVDWPAFYLERKGGSLCGLLAGEDNSIIVGLPVLRHFKYIVFDSIKKDVEFSSDKSFAPIQDNLWQKYPITIEEDLSGNAFLFVELPIAGEKVQVQFDTGSGNGLAVRQTLWQKLRPNFSSVRMKKGNDVYPYIGRLNCEKTVIPELQVGNRAVKNAMVSVFADDCPLVDECGALLGMQYFFDTAIALDFENNLLWVKI